MPVNRPSNEFMLLKNLIDLVDKLVKQGQLPASLNDPQKKRDLVLKTARVIAANMPKNLKSPLKLDAERLKIALKAVFAMQKNPQLKFNFQLLFKENLSPKERLQLTLDIKDLLTSLKNITPGLANKNDAEIGKLASQMVDGLIQNNSMNQDEEAQVKTLLQKNPSNRLAKNVTAEIGGAIIVLPFTGPEGARKETLSGELSMGYEEVLEEEGLIPQSADEFKHPETQAFDADAFADLIADIFAEESAENALLNRHEQNDDEEPAPAAENNSRSPFKTPRFMPPGSKNN